MNARQMQRRRDWLARVDFHDPAAPTIADLWATAGFLTRKLREEEMSGRGWPRLQSRKGRG